MVVTTKGLCGLIVEVDIERTLLSIVVGSDIVESCYVVAVCMGYKYRVDVGYLISEHLLSKIGAYIEKNILSIVS